ncbi:hypothetical protein DFP72DRAFT_969135 [Ephemerocybe angulata]|uniref:Crinkler effector protein N-terminal domain-containing protein n=1 Tax=Ephemerocybe angulata TaxID=980116 RepID=A0A8H6M3G1_9AGAR|nr:hypothetical protein DFP72DRAFT_969135 [Tulosesus angulatus]
MSDIQINLNCLSSGYPAGEIFSVKISLHESVSDLKDMIKQILGKPTITGIQLIKVLLAPSEAQLASDPDEIKNAVALSPLDKIKDVFKGDLPSWMIHVVVLSSSDPGLAWLYREAWGKKWPTQTTTLTQVESSRSTQSANPESDSEAMDIDTDNNTDNEIDNEDRVVSTPPPEPEYTCLREMVEVAKTLKMARGVRDFLLVREEYPKLANFLMVLKEKGSNGALVTGQAGIGKSVFLIYLLLHRLEQKLPTAIQFATDSYTIFDDKGANCVHFGSSRDDVREDERLGKSWALTDSSINLITPSDCFLSASHFLVQTASPNRERSKDWVKETSATVIVLELPSSSEITAIMKVHGHNPADVPPLIEKWGPCTRSIFKIMTAHNPKDAEAELQKLAEQAAQAIWTHPSSFEVEGIRIPDSQGSTLLFVQPNAPLSSLCSQSIPTRFLRNIFDERSIVVKNEDALALFRTFSKHSYTRTTAGWGYEQLVHKRLCRPGEALSISRAGSTMGKHSMHPSTNLLPGTDAFLKGAILSKDAFYWMPAIGNLSGIDGVLRNDDDNVYAVQATLASTHIGPAKGLKSLFKKISGSQAQTLKWHFVIIGELKSTVDSLAATALQELKKERGAIKDVEVWGCVFVP